jgi:divalent metal cation (Fe/Co/Zn/Cd) transporter
VYSTAVTKLILFLVCRRIDNPATRALAQDHRNDVVSNTGAIACGLIGLFAQTELIFSLPKSN